MGIFNWREPTNPYLPADGSLAEMNRNSMAGYRPLQLPVQKTPEQMAADAAQSMAGYTRNNMDNYRPNVVDAQGARGQQPTPDMEGYGESLEAASQAAAAAQAKEEKIANIKSQIAALEARIAENQGKLKNWTGNAAEIAAIEARKVNASDPTSIWRWKIDRDEARKISQAEKEKGNELAKLNAQIEIDNELASMVVDNKMTSNDEKVFLSKLSTLRTLAQKNGIPTDKIDSKIKEVKGDTGTIAVANSPEGSKFEGKPREQWTAEANDLLGNKKAKSKDIQAFLDQAGDNLDNDTRIKLNSAYRDLAKKEADQAYEKKWEAWLADYEKKNGAQSDRIKKHLRERFNKENKKG